VTPVDTSARLGSDSTAIIDVIVEIRRVDDSVHEDNRKDLGTWHPQILWLEPALQ